MRDQAEGLRRIAAARDDTAGREPAHAPAFVIGSGKGGVGKSALAVLLAHELARGPRRVLLVDASQNQGNLHVLLGAGASAGLPDVLRGEARPEDLLVPLGGGLTLLPSASGAENLYGLAAVDRARLHQRLTTLYERFDAVVVDTGSGLESIVRATLRATRLVVVAMPEPAALADAYALIKIVHLQVPSLPIGVLVNRVADDDEGTRVFQRLNVAADRFLGRELEAFGSVHEQSSLRDAMRGVGDLRGALVAGIPEAARRLLDMAPSDCALRAGVVA